MLYVASDTHGTINLDTLRTDNLPGQVSDEDFLLLCGDVGMVWDGAEADRKLVEWYGSQPYTTLYIDGNHENHELLSKLPVTEWNGGKVHRVAARVVHLMRGQVYCIEGKRIFCFGGAFSIKKVSGGSSVPIWDSEMPSREEYLEGWSNLEATGFDVDFVFTHTCPTSCLARLHTGFYSFEKELNDYLEQVMQKVRWKRWYFGHFHTDLDIGDFRALHQRVLRVQ